MCDDFFDDAGFWLGFAETQAEGEKTPGQNGDPDVEDVFETHADYLEDFAPDDADDWDWDDEY